MTVELLDVAIEGNPRPVAIKGTAGAEAGANAAFGVS